MGKAEIGENAGKIWQLLSQEHETSIEKAAQKLHLSEMEVALSVGWLARENKVVFTESDGRTSISNGEDLNFAFG